MINIQKFMGVVDLGGVTASEPNVLANKMLGFMISGLSRR